MVVEDQRGFKDFSYCFFFFLWLKKKTVSWLELEKWRNEGIWIGRGEWKKGGGGRWLNENGTGWGGGGWGVRVPVIGRWGEVEGRA